MSSSAALYSASTPTANIVSDNLLSSWSFKIRFLPEEVIVLPNLPVIFITLLLVISISVPAVSLSCFPASITSWFAAVRYGAKSKIGPAEAHSSSSVQIYVLASSRTL